MYKEYSREFDIYMPCPKCLNEYKSFHLERWTHGGKCGGRLVIDDKAVVHCKKCGKSAHITKMRMTCGAFKHVKVKASRDEIASALSTGSIGVVDGSINWFRKILSNI